MVVDLDERVKLTSKFCSDMAPHRWKPNYQKQDHIILQEMAIKAIRKEVHPN